MLHIPNSAKGNCLTEKENHTLCLKGDIKSINLRIRDLSEISRGGKGGGNFKFGFGNEVTHPCNMSEIC